MKNFIVLTLSFSLIIGCMSPNGRRKSDAELKNTKWILETINGEKITTLESDKEIYVFFDQDEDRFNGFSGCNRIMGPTGIDGNKIDLSNTAGTMMTCIDQDMENKFMAALRSAKTFEIKGQKLSLLSEDGKAILTFKAVPSQE